MKTPPLPKRIKIVFLTSLKDLTPYTTSQAAIRFPSNTLTAKHRPVTPEESSRPSASPSDKADCSERTRELPKLIAASEGGLLTVGLVDTVGAVLIVGALLGPAVGFDEGIKDGAVVIEGDDEGIDEGIALGDCEVVGTDEMVGEADGKPVGIVVVVGESDGCVVMVGDAEGAPVGSWEMVGAADGWAVGIVDTVGLLLGLPVG